MGGVKARNIIPRISVVNPIVECTPVIYDVPNNNNERIIKGMW